MDKPSVDFIDNKGNFYIIGGKATDEKYLRKPNRIYEYVLQKYSKDLELLAEFDFKDNRWDPSSSCIFFIDDNGDKIYRVWSAIDGVHIIKWEKQ